jgi:serine/threonine-protein kinase
VQTATADPLIGRTLEGRYRIVDRIARGGMSTVYSAVDERLDRLVAVKIMSGALSSDPAFSDRFAREARAAARLTHLNTVAVYDQGSDTSNGEHHVFLVMELVQGRTLRDLIRERAAAAPGNKAGGTFTPAEAISIMQPVLSALSAAHRAGIVHRDVKPENILLSDDGVVKVADFGLARAVEADAASTRTGLMMGTVAYCAPEQITRGQADPRADVYASGVVLFELLTGKPPYQGESAMNVAYQHVHSRVPAPSSRAKGVPSEIDELVVLATDPDPDERPADAGEFLAELADIRAQLGLPVVPIPPRPRRTARPGGRDVAQARTTAHPRRPPGARTTDHLGAIAAAPHDTQIVPGRAAPGPARRTASPPPPAVIPPPKRKQLTERQRRRRRGLIALLVIILLGLGAGVAAWWFAAGRYSKVPNLHNDSLTSARAELSGAGFKVGSVATDFSETVPKNQVIGTRPGAGSRLERGKAVSITISLGKYRIEVPKVAGQTLEDAESAIAGKGLQFRVTQTSDDKVHAGNAIKTSPAAGEKVKKDQVVTIFVSSGPPVIDIPQFDPGTPVAQVDRKLKSLGLKVSHNEEFSDSVPKNGLITLAPSDQAVKFSTIVVTVSKGPQMVTIPDIAPLVTLARDAKAQLESLGLVVDLEPIPGARQDPVVLDMNPKSGERVRVGSTVTLRVF